MPATDGRPSPIGHGRPPNPPDCQPGRTPTASERGTCQYWFLNRTRRVVMDRDQRHVAQPLGPPAMRGPCVHLTVPLAEFPQHRPAPAPPPMPRPLPPPLPRPDLQHRDSTPSAPPRTKFRHQAPEHGPKGGVSTALKRAGSRRGLRRGRSLTTMRNDTPQVNLVRDGGHREYKRFDSPHLGPLLGGGST